MVARRNPLARFTTLIPILAALSQTAFRCESGGVGDPCTPEDEFREDFRGYAEAGVNVESRSFQCETRVCLVANFRGRATCPYGQPADRTDPSVVDPSTPIDRRCVVPGTDGQLVTVPVEPQLVERAPEDAVYCSCRCDGPDPNARYCECPSGYSCEPVVPDWDLGGDALAGSYCVREGQHVDDPGSLAAGPRCSPDEQSCAGR